MQSIIIKTDMGYVEMPEIVYKYRDWNNPVHKRVLTHREFYFASPNECQEQYECNLPVDYDQITSDLAYRFYYETAPSYGYITDEDRKAIATEMVQKRLFDAPEHRVVTEQKFRSRLNRDLALFCVSPFKDNFNLWEVFADSQTGFCVGLNTAKLVSNEQLIGSGGVVKYYKTGEPPKVPAISLNDEERIKKMMTIVYSLPDIYSEEKEYRFAKMYLPDRRFILPVDCFAEVIVGSSMPDDNVNMIRQLVENNMPGCKVIKANTNLSTEKYEFVSVS